MQTCGAVYVEETCGAVCVGETWRGLCGGNMERSMWRRLVERSMWRRLVERSVLAQTCRAVYVEETCYGGGWRGPIDSAGVCSLSLSLSPESFPQRHLPKNWGLCACSGAPCFRHGTVCTPRSRNDEGKQNSNNTRALWEHSGFLN